MPRGCFSVNVFFIILFLDFTAPEMEFEASEKALKASEANSEIGFKFKRCHFRGKKYDSTALLPVIMLSACVFPNEKSCFPEELPSGETSLFHST